jgi:Mrp family chromosome partitioning ATPase
MDESSSSRTAVDTIVDLARKWQLILPFAIVTPLVAVAITASQPAVHSSSADVLLNRQAYVVSGLRDATFYYPNRAQLTQARLARLPEVAQRVVDAAGLADRGRYGFLAQSWVGAGGGTDVMTFNVSDRDPELASRLATTYAKAYIAYRRELDTRSLSQAIAVVGRQMEQIRGTDPIAFADLVSKQQQLQTALSALKTNAILVRPGGIAEQVAPRPYDSLRSAGLLGLVVGVGLAALALLLDPRSRTAEDIAEQVGVPLLGVLPREQRLKRGKIALGLPRSDESRSDAVRMLRTVLELARLGPREGVMLVTSAVAGEGKSTTAAHLALAYALTGRDVVLVDLDLRRPAIARLLRQPPEPGVTDVLGSSAALDRALRPVAFDTASSGGREQASAEDAPGTLRFLTAGTRLAPDSTAITSPQAIHRLLESLRESADLVIVDAPPLLQTNDPLGLSVHADGVLVVLDARRYRRRYAPQLRQLLTMSSAQPLGIVVVADPRRHQQARAYTGDGHSVPRRLHSLGRV